ncbi:bis(5'-nucleosyl)-tetraphosphatase PrpE [Gracilibacillus alcaliphilus]|uniref:bis(5'-nucleosyl)-tetraphosphatase PrpE n=1 Tax=Gracilibacillus alcaliphilus TaxID=1401441 RepID=UPI00195A8236|nr:diadenosine tetraphosphatase ApaH/serine/threonine PP2A family protein phosphatase [Gracilibacillus alcaliphilus]
MKLDIIGDIHGCFQELEDLLHILGYQWQDKQLLHPEGRQLAFIGDLTDRGPHSIAVIKLVYDLVIRQKQAYYVPGNHCNKLFRFFLGNKVQLKHGLETTVAEWEQLPKSEQEQVRQMMLTLYQQAPLYQSFDSLNLVIAHAGIPEKYIGQSGSRVKTFVLYGDITGKQLADGRPERRDWAQEYQGDKWIVYGHTPVLEARFVQHTVNIDTGCVFGNKLTAIRFPEKEIVDVPSRLPFTEEKFQ